MMSNVTYKKFDDCIESVKYTTKLQSKDFLPEGKYPIISQEEDLISGYWNNDNDVFHAPRPLVIFGDHTRVLKYVDFDFVLGADGVKILLPTEDIMAKYLLYYLKWYNIPSLGYSRHFKLLRDISVPVPSLEDQQRIVRELDAIHVILDAKNEQLRELDNLAQTIFYDLFGDPAVNEKGWDMLSIREVFPFIKNGANIKQTKGADGLPITRIETLSGGKFNRDRLGYANIYDTEKYAPYYLETGDILMSHINGKAYLGRAVMYTKVGEEQIIHGMNLLRLKANKDIVNPCFATYYFMTDDFKAKIVSIRKDAVNQSSFSTTDLSKLSFPLPPLDLQQAFASKISAIEQQKELIRASIAETEALLAARMQHYFD